MSLTIHPPDSPPTLRSTVPYLYGERVLEGAIASNSEITWNSATKPWMIAITERGGEGPSFAPRSTRGRPPAGAYPGENRYWSVASTL